jgi:hypothetical protein
MWCLLAALTLIGVRDFSRGGNDRSHARRGGPAI